MTDLGRRLRALETAAAPLLKGPRQIECDVSDLTDEQRQLAEQTQAEWERLSSKGSDWDLERFVAALPDNTKRVIARIRIVDEA